LESRWIDRALADRAGLRRVASLTGGEVIGRKSGNYAGILIPYYHPGSDRGVWIIELSELDSLSHSEVARIKAFMSRTTDRFRPPYGMRLVESPRQCIFAGTVNHSTYLRDETGGRRFWPIACGRIDVDALARGRDQLWAETKARFESGAVCWLDTADLVQMASDQQIERYEGDPWEEVIGPWVESRPSASISETQSR